MDSAKRRKKGISRRIAPQSRKSESYLIESQRLSHVGSWVCYPDLETTYFSPEMFRILGFSMGDPLPSRQEIGKRFAPEDWERITELFETVRREKIANSEFLAILPDGSNRVIGMVVHPVVDSADDFAEFVVTCIDVTEQRQATTLLQKAFDEAKKSEEQLRAIINTIPSQLWCGLPDGANEFSNKTWEDFTAVSSEEGEGWGWTAAMHPDEMTTGLLDYWHSVMATGKTYDREARIRRFDGVYRWFLCRAAPLRDESGKVVKWCGTNLDIHDRKLAEEELKRSEERYRVIVEATSDAVISMDESGVIVFANRATTGIFGYDPAELIGKPLTVLIPEFMRRLHVTESGQRPHTWQGTELTALRENGQEFPVEVSFAEMTGSGHNVFTGFIRDVSDRKRAEGERERLRRAESDLAHINRVSTMGELTASLSHEIKQPISAALTDAGTCFGWLARDEPDLSEARQAASRAIKDVRRASDIINRIGLLFKKGPPQREVVDLNEIIREMIALLRAEANRHSILMHDELANGLPQIPADRIQLQQVLMNLMLNGIEAMKDAGPSRNLGIKSRQEESRQLLVSVTDTGVGLQPEHVDQIFKAFFTSKSQGTGMGLPICRSIIESHGGRLWATPNSGPGATFQFTLPIDLPRDVATNQPM
jgi:PAS domain S-box-containing protein